MRKGDIYWANVCYRFSSYPRPCVVIGVDLPFVHVGLISSKIDLFNPVFDFLIEQEHQDFSSTGLSKSSYVIGSILPRIQATSLTKRIGQLVGGQYNDFEEWLG